MVPGKRARPVLRGRGRSNASPLPDASIIRWCVADTTVATLDVSCPLAFTQGGHPRPERIRSITDRSRLLVPVGEIVQELNLFLRGWAGYFRYGNSALLLGQIRNFALKRLALWLSKRGKRRRAWGVGMTQLMLSPNQLGLISLDGIVVPPRPFRDWRAERRR